MADTGHRRSTEPPVRIAGRAPLVGRDLELAELQQALDRSIAGHSGTVVVRGDPGSGRTRLIDELIAGNEHRAVVLTARCSQMATGLLTPAFSLLDQASQLPDDASRCSPWYRPARSIRRTRSGSSSGAARSTAIDLTPLSEIELRDLLIGHGVPNPDRRFVTLMSEVSRGNPLFVREALRQNGDRC